MLWPDSWMPSWVTGRQEDLGTVWPGSRTPSQVTGRQGDLGMLWPGSHYKQALLWWGRWAGSA